MGYEALGLHYNHGQLPLFSGEESVIGGDDTPGGGESQEAWNPFLDSPKSPELSPGV